MIPKSQIRKFLIGIFDDEESLVKSTKLMRDKKIPIYDIFSPYAIHGLDEIMGIKRSRLPIVCFIAGCIGLLIALSFQLWIFTKDWPINIGGKPFNSLPAFVPVSFEFTVLIGGLATVAAFLFRSKLFPGAQPKLFDSLTTDNHFVIAIEKKDASLDDLKLEEVLKANGAIEVREGEVENE